MAQRGFFALRNPLKFRDILDELSNTICAPEIATDLSDRDNRNEATGSALDLYGVNGALGCHASVGPQRPQFWLPGTPAVKFITDSIEAGNLNSAMVRTGAAYLPAGS